MPKADEGAVLAKISQSGTAPHPHFVSPSPRKKTRGEGLSIGLIPAVSLEATRGIPSSDDAAHSFATDKGGCVVRRHWLLPPPAKGRVIGRLARTCRGFLASLLMNLLQWGEVEAEGSGLLLQ